MDGPREDLAVVGVPAIVHLAGPGVDDLDTQPRQNAGDGEVGMIGL